MYTKILSGVLKELTYCHQICTFLAVLYYTHVIIPTPEVVVISKRKSNLLEYVAFLTSSKVVAYQ